MKNTANLTKTVEIISFSDLVPDIWQDWFNTEFENLINVSFGDAEHTLVSKGDMIIASKEAIESKKARHNIVDPDIEEAFLDMLEDIDDNTFIDIEN